MLLVFFFFSSRRRHTRWPRDWSSDVCSSDLRAGLAAAEGGLLGRARRQRRPTRAGRPVVGDRAAARVEGAVGAAGRDRGGQRRGGVATEQEVLGVVGG